MNMDTELDNPNATADDEGAFVASNAEFFAQAFAPLSAMFGSPGSMLIVSEETEMTVAVGVRETGEDGVMDVDCVMLEANQESLRDCIDTLFTEE